MSHRFLVTLVGTFAVALLATGCGKTDSQPPIGAPPVAATNAGAAFLKFHWVGKKQIVAANVATNFLALWNLPESAKLEEQTLDKLAAAPWRLWATNVAVSNAPTAQLRPLLADLVQEEFYLEAQAGSNQSTDWLLAVKLPAERVPVWQTNLSQVLAALFPGTAASISGSELRFQTSDFSLDFRPRGAWTLLTFGAAPERDAGLLPATNLPAFAPGSNQWIAAEVDWVRLDQALHLNWPLPARFPRATLALVGDQSDVRTAVDFFFPTSVGGSLEAWNIPTNLINDPLIAFSAVRSVPALWAAISGDSQGLKTEKLPPQLVTWANAGYPLQTFFSIPTVSPSNDLAVVWDWLQHRQSYVSLSNFPGRFAFPTNPPALTMEGVPFMSAYLVGSNTVAGDFLVGGLVPPIIRTNRPIPPALLAQLSAKPDLVYYDWEITGPRIEAWVYIGQTFRLLFNKAQLPPNSLGFAWLKKVLLHAGNAATAANLVAPDHLRVSRVSTFGLTGLELHGLVDWLESPDFPRGFHSDQPNLLRASRPRTNSPALPPMR